MIVRFNVNLEKLSKFFNHSLVVFTFFFFFLGWQFSFFFHFLTVPFFTLVLLNSFFRYVQKESALLANFGFFAQLRYVLESIGPEMRQYFFMSDTEEKPFNRIERSDVYKKAKGIDSTTSFGTLFDLTNQPFKLTHSMFPLGKAKIIPFILTFGEERRIKNAYSIHKPIMISGMSYGALSKNAVRALSRGARKAQIAINTGEGGFPKYHLNEKPDIIFQMGTAKFGVRKINGLLDEKKLMELAKIPEIKMIEIKLSQGAKPGKGGILPREKITSEIAELRHVSMDEDVLSPAFHAECSNYKNTVKFIKRVQIISGLPTGIKMCLGRVDEFRKLVDMMKKEKVFPDYIALDGAEGGTGAAPKTFLDDIGMDLFEALQVVQKILIEKKVRNKLKLICSGKLINAGKQLMALSLGADALYIARGFMLSIGCIQALQCNQNTCPIGITTQKKSLYRGLDIESRSNRVVNYVNKLIEEHKEVLAALGLNCYQNLTSKNLIFNKKNKIT